MRSVKPALRIPSKSQERTPDRCVTHEQAQRPELLIQQSLVVIRYILGDGLRQRIRLGIIEIEFIDRGIPCRTLVERTLPCASPPAQALASVGGGSFSLHAVRIEVDSRSAEFALVQWTHLSSLWPPPLALHGTRREDTEAAGEFSKVSGALTTASLDRTLASGIGVTLVSSSGRDAHATAMTAAPGRHLADPVRCVPGGALTSTTMPLIWCQSGRDRSAIKPARRGPKAAVVHRWEPVPLQWPRWILWLPPGNAIP